MGKVDVVLMRSNSGNQILDIDFGAAEAAIMAASRGQGGHQLQHAQPHLSQAAHPYAGAQYMQPMQAGCVMGGMFHAGALGMPPQMQQQLGGMQAPGSSMAVPMAMRKLKIVEHHVHRIDTHTKDNGEPEEELVVSNLRHFTLKVAVVDSNEMPILDTELPLQATLLYENGLPVKQLSNSEPLLAGEPEVVALQGSAVFKLRITSLSSHRDKQRFRIQIAPHNPLVRQHEPSLTIVTDPMKSVTKLAHRSSAKEGGGAAGAGGPAAGVPHPFGPGANGPDGGMQIDAGAYEAMVATLKQHSEQIGQLQEMHTLILKQLQDLNSLVRGLVTGPTVAPPPGPDES